MLLVDLLRCRCMSRCMYEKTSAASTLPARATGVVLKATLTSFRRTLDAHSLGDQLRSSRLDLTIVKDAVTRQCQLSFHEHPRRTVESAVVGSHVRPTIRSAGAPAILSVLARARVDVQAARAT